MINRLLHRHLRFHVESDGTKSENLLLHKPELFMNHYKRSSEFFRDGSILDSHLIAAQIKQIITHAHNGGHRVAHMHLGLGDLD